MSSAEQTLSIIKPIAMYLIGQILAELKQRITVVLRLSTTSGKNLCTRKPLKPWQTRQKITALNGSPETKREKSHPVLFEIYVNKQQNLTCSSD